MSGERDNRTISGERGRGVVLRVAAALLLVVGAGWWWSARPRSEADPRLLTWRLAAEQLLPETGDQETAETLVLAAGADYAKTDDLDGGAFLISVVCAGPDDSSVRVSLGEGEEDSGRGLRCSGSRTPEVFSVGVGSRLHLRVVVDQAGPIIFRYTLERSAQG
ncbi:hypothetical protein GCM10010168_00150 [Actinoplanes ianthinogenes]|uniref:Uncharacterized protein n=1 Tax=Actinoplanes ianthinogenes TaxID=122358 RepID=A0ABN6CDJ9_9ACTN|nr:DUF6023 family protein [Actinoplanes ianthinogenes]BCJ43243.1 hypothetical protein Aiant_39000 [Actinoplanes ianthinogenes]GGQ89315.1 hypothetical protein GCM10010168_00150 [Actinoplanes ianthinogenes]